MGIGTEVATTVQDKFYQQVIEYSVEPTILHLNHEIIYINNAGAKFIGAEKESIIGTPITNTLLETDKPKIKARIAKVIKTNEPAKLIKQEIIKADGTVVEIQLSCHPIIYSGQVVIQTVFRDITSKKNTEKSNARLLEEINEITTPVVPILEGISVLPLVGSIDRDRGERLLEDIPMKIKEANLQCLIIDFSGVSNFDSTVVDYLHKLYRVLKLLGVDSIITGIRPGLAMASLALGGELNSIKTSSTVLRALQSLGVQTTIEIK
ncbi:PAS domain S-box protein [Sporosarcina sp. G11-34]|uniref:PAS domain S-box protein n=1 Tax=Sporosarcina sp. G11-34 TaxID=2849605 RepID=UPI0022A96678|nr:PAS domain S-box protein [Sporosarcina sp. G11-34]MCZ2257828.1 PAS domain S-box protein [Sporosarcina sp. G11-34]